MNKSKPIAALYPSTMVLNEIGVGLIMVDYDGNVAVTNAIAEELLDRRVNKTTTLRDELVTIALAQVPNGPPSRADELPPASQSSEQRLIEVVDSSNQRSIIGYRFVRSPSLGIIFTLRDITEIERGRTERLQLERLSQVGKACAMVAHEIGNPLAAIKATIQSIEREAAAAGLQDPISVVYSEIDRLDKILGQLLSFVRHRAPRKTKMVLQQVVDKAKTAAESRFTSRILFTANYGPGMQPIYADPDQIQQVLLNLFINAADAMPDGGAIMVNADVQAGKMTIRVEDEGPGIPPELREKVFESFYTTKQTGTGLGLSVCYRIISDHGGSISVEGRDEGKGAAIVLTLPVRNA